MASDAMAATSQPMATQAALGILRDGGNALDAAVAASAVLAVVEPFSTGIGGDCFILYHEASTGKLHALNGSGAAAAKTSVDALRERGLDAIPELGINAAVTVPGAIDAWHTACESLGRIGFDRVLQPAIHYAEDGFAVSPIVGTVWAQTEEILAMTPESSAAYLVDGKAPAIGSLHRLPDLARTLRIIAERGRDGFYLGEVAEEIVRFSESMGGWYSLDDFANQHSEWVEPQVSHYRGYELYEIPPNGQGITAQMTLNILGQTDLAQHEHLGPDHVHLLCEAFSMAMAERDHYISDPRFNEMPVEHLLSDAFAKDQFARIDMQRALPQPLESALPRHKDTVYLTVVDQDRNACSFINSTFHGWGSGLVAGSTGVNLHNRGASFRLDPEHFNCIEPGKRPMHTIIPAMMYRDGKPVLSFGVMGADYQAMGQAYVATNWIDYGMDIQEAMDAPRFMLDEQLLKVERGVPAATRDALSGRGHEVVEAEAPHGGGQAIVIDWENGVLQGASDPRKDGCAAGY